MGRGRWHPSLTTWVDQVDARWQQLGVSAAQRHELRLELVADLSQARQDGAPLEELLAIDPDRFATDVAVAQGFTVSAAHVAPATGSRPEDSHRTDPPEVTVTRVVLAGLLGAVVGGVVGLAALLPVFGWATHHQQPGSAVQVASMLTIYVVAALVAAVSGGFAVSSAYADSPNARLLGRRAAGGLVLSGAVATLVTVSYAGATGYSTRGPVVLAEVGLVIGSCLVGLVLVARSTRPVRSRVAGRAS